ncbi:glycosyltransferase family 4 protein [Acidobacteria bacterium AH-259-L09]|nr:glycosyltransferase family 4 protein [Acidobacteria bacterium AH-259-L09]
MDQTVFNPGGTSAATLKIADIPPDAPVVLNPRGFRTYVRNDAFFRSIPLVLRRRPDAVFLCIGMQNEPTAERWIHRLAIGHAVRLLPVVHHEQMAGFFRLARVMVSPSVHDGTPNTLLEAMACGSFPVAGDIESVREWITDGLNGLLCDPTEPRSIADSILRALNDHELCRRGMEYNLKLVAERANYEKVMAQVERFYCQVVEHT